jgi:hypothetical protein
MHDFLPGTYHGTTGFVLGYLLSQLEGLEKALSAGEGTISRRRHYQQEMGGTK